MRTRRDDSSGIGGGGTIESVISMATKRTVTEMLNRVSSRLWIFITYRFTLCQYERVKVKFVQVFEFVRARTSALFRYKLGLVSDTGDIVLNSVTFGSCRS